MKKTISIILSIMLILAITFQAAAVSTIAVKSIKLNNSKITLKVGQTSNLKVTFVPANTTQKKLTYVTGNKKIATVNATGKITGVSKGTTTITVYTLNKKIFAKCNVTILAKTAVPQKKIKIGYISKMLTHPWFIQEDSGLKKKAAELGIDYVSVDANLKDEQCMAAVDNLIAQKIDGLAICVTNQGLGPAIAKKCKEAGVALVTIDDTMKDENDKQVPHVGFPVKDLAKMGGKELAKIARERGFFSKGNVVKVMQIDMPQLSVVHDRTIGYKEALMEACPELKDADFIQQGSETGMFDKNLPIASAILNAHPEVTHWIVTGINDDGALAPIKIFQENKFNMDNVIACALGGYELAQAEFQKGSKSIIAIGLRADTEGEKAVQALYDNIVNKKPLPELTSSDGKMVTLENWKEYFNVK